MTRPHEVLFKTGYSHPDRQKGSGNVNRFQLKIIKLLHFEDDEVQVKCEYEKTALKDTPASD